MNDEEVDELTGRIIAAAIEVHRALGPGLLESIYKSCLVLELRARDVDVEVERRVHLTYQGVPIEGHLIVDLVVQATVIVEIKSVALLAPVHSAQVLTYLRLTGCPAGLLLNFNVDILKHGIRRLVHPDRYTRKQAAADVVR